MTIHKKYIDFLKDVKDLIQDHASELKTHDVTEIMRTVLKTVRDPLHKFLHPNESPLQTVLMMICLVTFQMCEEDDIFHEFPPGTWTDGSATNNSKIAKKLSPSQCHWVLSGLVQLSMIHTIFTMK